MLSLLSAVCTASRFVENEPMCGHTSFRIGGPARYFMQAGSSHDVAEALRLCHEKNFPCLIIGRGSNLLVSDKGLDMLVIEIGDGMSEIRTEGRIITAQAGARLSVLSQEAARQGLTGLEFASGIPGSVGGGVAMNAGAYGGELSDCLVRATVLEEGQILELAASEMDLGYRTSRVLNRDCVVLEAQFEMLPDDPAQISARMQELNRRRREKQPLAYPSAGSVFKRPEGHFAGALIEQAGLKGYRVGGAMVSDLHAGFIINVDHATAHDVMTLIQHIEHTVYQQSGVHLETEIRLLGF